MKRVVYSSKRLEYTYDGPIRDSRTGEIIVPYFSSKTYAVSFPQAINNFRQQVFQNFELPRQFVEFDMQAFNGEDFQRLETHADYCQECGTQLTDGGQCPVCDLGE